jgi:hypothetical protein
MTSNEALKQNINKVAKIDGKRFAMIMGVLERQEIYIQSILEYDKRFWFLPKGTIFGKYFFKKIIRRKVDELKNN